MPELRFLGMSKNPMINPKGSLQSQVPKAFITTLPVTKENIKKWGAIVGAGVAGLVGAIAAVTLVTKKSNKGKELWAEPVSAQDAAVFDTLYKALEACNTEEFDLHEFKGLLGQIKDFDLLLKRKELIPLSLIDVVAGSNCDIDVVKALAHVNPKIVNLHGLNGLTLLHYAAVRYNLPLVKFLVENGANVNARDDTGRTPIFYVTDIWDEEVSINKEGLQKKNQAIINYLLRNGADLTLRDRLGNTIFHHLAELRSADQNIDLIKRLLLNADLNLLKSKNDDDKTAWEIAHKNSSAQKIYTAIYQQAVDLGLLSTQKRFSRESR
jgi:hypothetical protein